MSENVPDLLEFSAETPTVAKRHKPSSGLNAGLLLTVFFCVLLSAGVSVSILLIGKDNVLSVFGVKPEVKPDPLVPIRNEIAKQQAEILSIQQNLQDQVEDLKVVIANNNKTSELLTNRIMVIEKSVATYRNDLEKKIASQEKVITTHKTKVAAKPKEPLHPISIVSIRGWGNAGFVSVKQGLDYSDLLSIGDSWRGWQLVDVDTEGRKATFVYQGQTKVLVM